MTRDPYSPASLARADEARQARIEAEAELRAAGEEALAALVEWYRDDSATMGLLDVADRYVRALEAVQS